MAICYRKQKMPDGDLTIATRALCGFRRSYVGALGKAALLFFSLSSRERHRQIRLSRLGDRISNSSARNLSIVIYIFGGFENGRIAAFKLVEVCGVDAVVPNNGTTISVRVA